MSEIGYCAHIIRVGQVWETNTDEEVTIAGWSGDMGENLHVRMWDPELQVFVIRTVHLSSVGNWRYRRTLWERLLV